MDEKVIFWVNIFKEGSFYSLGAAIYEIKEKAEETGKMVKGYITTVSVEFDKSLEN